MKHRAVLALATTATMLASSAVLITHAAAQDAASYPNKAVRIIVPFPAGGTADLLPRVLAEKMSAKWGQPIVVENRPGAAGNIGAEVVFRAEPDGYTLLSAPPPPLVINASLYPKLNYEPTQFVPITIIGSVPNVLLVHPKVTASSLEELIAFARAHPDKLNYASQGSGSTGHLTGELFKSMANVGLTHVPYKGSAPALTDLIAGQVELMFDNLGASMQHVRAGKIRALGIGSPKRVASLPNVQSISEVLPGFSSTAWFGVVGPPKMSMAIAEKVSIALADALKHPDVVKRLAELTAEPMGTTPAQTAAFMREETERWRSVIRSANVKVD